MKIIRRKLLICLLSVLCVLTAVLGYQTYAVWKSISNYKVPRMADAYELKMGYGARNVADDLAGDVFFRPFLHLWLRCHPELDKVQKGSYAVDGTKTLQNILEDMVAGRILVKEYPNLVIIEGTNFADVLARLKKLPRTDQAALDELDDPEKFLAETLKKDPELLKSIGGTHKSFEGLLLPATYPVVEEQPVNAVVRRAVLEMASFMKEEWPRRDHSVKVDGPYEVLILASIIERETLLDDERSHIAAVFYNRLDRKMKLQADPVVMYGVSPEFKGTLTKAQLKADTPYNTYTRNGLPPTPISMPSKSSILAALHPAVSDAVYFVAKGVSPKEGHVFSATLKEHNKAVSTYRSKVKDYRRRHQNETRTLLAGQSNK